MRRHFELGAGKVKNSSSVCFMECFLSNAHNISDATNKTVNDNFLVLIVLVSTRNERMNRGMFVPTSKQKSR